VAEEGAHDVPDFCLRSGGTDSYYCNKGASMADGSPHNVVLRYHSSSKLSECYIDGSFLTNYTFTNSQADLYGIGRSDWVGVPRSGGSVDDLAVTNNIMPTSTIQAIWNSGSGSEVCTTSKCGFMLDAMQQYKSDASTVINYGSSTVETTVIFGAKLYSAGTSTLQLQVEVQPTSTSFTNIANATSSFVASSSSATATKNSLSLGEYHWQARVLENGTNATTSWQLFGL
jgi:hypothetical protein